MRKRVHLLAIATALIAIGALGATSYAAATSKPSLKVVSWHPFTVAGRHFKPHAHVTVALVSATPAKVKHVTVSRQGRFKVTFSFSPVSSCTQWSVRATQPGRAPVVLRSGPRPECPPA